MHQRSLTLWSLLCLVGIVAACSSGSGKFPVDASGDAAVQETRTNTDQASADTATVDSGGEDIGDVVALPDSAPNDTDPLRDADASDAGGQDLREFWVTIWESCPVAVPGQCSAYASASGWSDYLVPLPKPTLTVGQCAFIRPEPPAFCDPACGPGTVCNLNTLTCVAPRPPISAGVIEITGLKSACTVTPETQYYYYTPTFDPEPVNGDIYDPGATITATAPGAEVPAFEISGVGVQALDSSLACPPELAKGQDLLVSWTPADEGTVSLFIGSGNHGDQFSHIVCTADKDPGQFVVDGSLVTELLNDGAPIWAWRLNRESLTNKVAGDYKVVLSISSGQGCSW